MARIRSELPWRDAPIFTGRRDNWPPTARFGLANARTQRQSCPEEPVIGVDAGLYRYRHSVISDGLSNSPTSGRNPGWIAMTDFYMTGSNASAKTSFFIFDGTDWVNPPSLPGANDRVLFVEMKSGSLNVDEIASFTGFPNSIQIVGIPTIKSGSVKANEAPLDSHIEGEDPAAPRPAPTSPARSSTGQRPRMAFSTRRASRTRSPRAPVVRSTSTRTSRPSSARLRRPTAGTSASPARSGRRRCVFSIACAITAASIESVGTFGMTNRVEGGTLTTGKYDIVARSQMTDVLDL